MTQFAIDPVYDAAVRHVLDYAMLSFYAFTLVVARTSGLMAIGPLFGHSVVPLHVRLLMVLALSLLITPTINSLSQTNPSQSPLEIAPSLLDYACIIVAEFALGFILGLGVLTILSGLQLAGLLIDQQIGVALGEVFHPDIDNAPTLTGQWLYFLGTTVFLVMEPLNGHLMLVSALIETYHVLPVGHAIVTAPSIEALRDVVHQSLVLAVQVASPVLAAMSLVALAVGVLGRTIPQINVLVIGFPMRALVSLLILALTLTGLSQAVVAAVPEVLDEIGMTIGLL